MDPIAWGAFPWLDDEEDPTCDAAELAEAGDREGSRKLLMEVLSGHLYEEYALDALDFRNAAVPRKKGRVALAGIGSRSRLSCLVRRSRTKQQQRLWEALFLNARDSSTLLLSERLIAAHRDGVIDAEPILKGFLAGRWGDLEPEIVNKVEVALAFGRLARVLLDRFNRAYGYVDEHGWVADFEAVSAAAFPEEEMAEVRSACAAVLEASGASRFRKLPEHGPELLLVLAKLAGAGSRDCLEHLMSFTSASSGRAGVAARGSGGSRRSS
jgi:hypothetical protein